MWAPRAESISLRIGRAITSSTRGFGVHEATVEAEPGDRYWFVLDGRRLADPCSRWQPKGLRGPSAVPTITPAQRSAIPSPAELVIYELHVGTFTEEGTFEAAAAHLASSPRSASRRSRSCRWPSSLDITGGATTASTSPHRIRPTAARRAGRAGRGRARARAERDPRRRLQPRRRLGRQGARPIRALLHLEVRDPLGPGDQLRRRRTAIPCASGSCRAPRAGSATTGSTGCDSTRSTRSTTPAPSTSWPRSRAVRTRSATMRW